MSATKTKNPFVASQFTPTQFSTTADKAKFANHFVKFVLGGFAQRQFPKWFYTRLRMTFGHIAHYNQVGFYDTWFARPHSQREFIEHTLRHPCYGDPAHTFSDVEKALIGWLRNNRAAVEEVLDRSAQQHAEAAIAERQRREAAAQSPTQQFKVVAKSTGTGSFGHRQYVVVAQDGSAYKLHIVPSNLSLERGQVLDVPLKNGEPQWSRYYVECPERLANAPPAVVAEVWGE